MRSPRSVTRAPTDMPWRKRNCAIDTRALVMTAFWPVTFSRMPVAFSRSFLSSLAAPTPHERVILRSSGHWWTLSMPRRSIRRGRISFLY